MMNRSNNVAVLGEGAFGTAITYLLVNCGISVDQWCYNSSIIH